MTKGVIGMKDIIMKHDQHIMAMKEEVKDKVSEAFRSGCSVAQISRALMCKTYQFAYRIIQTERLIGNAPTRYKPEFVPEKLLGTFRTVRFSFPKWCVSHDFDIPRADRALAGLPASDDRFAARVHQALRNDFKYLYEELYLGESPRGQLKSFDRNDPEGKSLSISWRDDLDCYFAQVPEMPEVWAVGETVENAFRSVKFVFNLRRQVVRLDKLIVASRRLNQREKIAVWE